MIGSLARIFLVRHGEVDYDRLSHLAPVYDGTRYDFAPLSTAGVRQAEQIARALRVNAPRLVVSSPYTRTLQTAAILACRLDAELTIDLTLHDWLPQRDGSQPIHSGVVAVKIAEYEAWRSGAPLDPSRTWETDDDMRQRLARVVNRLRMRQVTIVVVTHEAPIKAALGLETVPLASWHEWPN